ncbi:NYN domain-containing protein [Isoptericola sp. NPDC056134]|uniref:NYN domain-containing protein n=1 Tax=Isoptericola sp. NPDC056134 TaxID=3345723 RepID=UPI0035F0C887
MSSRGRACVYIDGFNLYYGALKGSTEKWLDLAAWSGLLLPGYAVERIVYCTARITGRPDDPDAHVRQDAYLRALATLPTVDVLEGIFKVSKPRMFRISPDSCDCCGGHQLPCSCCRGSTVQVMKTEEKGSDVNLAVQLVVDGFQDRFDTALVVSNDSDIQPAVDVVRTQLGKRVIVADPRSSRYPALIGDERRRVRREPLVQAQFPSPVVGADGRAITRPNSWE